MAPAITTGISNNARSVLIVGAGPTGLILGAELLRRNVPIRLVDKLSSPLTTSRAFTVHSRTLEALDVVGLTNQLKVQGGGVHAQSMQYHFVPGEEGCKKVVKTLRLEFGNSVVRGRHPGILTVPQTVTERVLREGFEKLGGKIEWNTELSAFEETDSGVAVTLRNGEKEEEVRFDYLVGCDGARSSVRKKQNLEFAGLHYAGMTLKMMDVSLGGTLDTSKFEESGYHYLIKEKSMLLLAKMGDVEDYKGDQDIWRVLLSTQETEPDTSLEAFQKGVDKVLDGVKLSKPHWTVAYRIHKRMVTEYISEKGRLLLAGDAAHINSPAGGQGMNTAIQDGFNLGWKLALVCHGLAKEGILKTYDKERKPIAEKVLEGTDLLHSVMMAHGKKLKDRIEKASAEHWLEKAVLRISGQAYTYGNDQREDLLGNDVVVANGDQAPDILMDSAKKLQDTYSDVLTVVQAASMDSSAETDVGKMNPMDVPSNEVLKSQYGGAAAALIRPDRYVEALVTSAIDLEDTVKEALAILK